MQILIFLSLTLFLNLINSQSIAYSSRKSYGSGVESKYGSHTIGSKFSSNHDSYAIKGKSGAPGKSGATGRSGATGKSGATSGSGATGKSGATSGSGSTGRSVATGRSGATSGSGATGKSGAINYSSATGRSGSINYSSSNSGTGASGKSGINSGSGTKSSISYNIFSPTRQPTEAMLPIYQPPAPTYRPTKTMAIPKIPITFDNPTPTNDGIVVPEIPLSFQIEQGADGWAKYPDTPSVYSIFKKVSANTAGITEDSITNMHIENTNRRILLVSIHLRITYNITISPYSIGERTPIATYNKITNRLITSIKNNNFSTELLRFGLPINITFIHFSDYTVFSYPTQAPSINQNILSSSGINNNAMKTSDIIYISISCLVALGMFIALFAITKKYRNSLINQKSGEISMTESLSREKVRNPMIDVIPKAAKRIIEPPIPDN
jgi:hypothetical protein